MQEMAGTSTSLDSESSSPTNVNMSLNPVNFTPEERQEMRGVIIELWKVAIPGAIASFFWNSTNFAVTMIVGQRLGAEKLEALTSGTTVYNVCAVSIGIGLISALDTLASQAFGRDPKTKELGELMQRSLIIVGLFAIPVFIFFHFSEQILAMVFSKTLAAGAGTYLANAHVLFFLHLFSFTLFSVLSACRLTQLPLYSAMAGFVVTLLLSFQYLDSIESAVWILTASVATNTAVLTYFVLSRPELEGVRRAKWPLAPEALRMTKMREYLKIGFPSMVGVCSEWWAVEVLFLISARINDTAVGVLAVVVSLMQLGFLLPGGISRGGTVTVGNALGANKPRLAKMSALAAMLTVLGNQILFVFLIFFFHNTMFSWWTSDPTIISITAALVPLIMLSMFCDGIQFSLQGIYRGVGFQEMAAKRVLFSLWAIGVTLSCGLGLYTSLGVVGVVLGNTIGLLTEVSLLLQGAATWDWVSLAKVASTNKESEEAVAEKCVELSDETDRDAIGDKSSPTVPDNTAILIDDAADEGATPASFSGGASEGVLAAVSSQRLAGSLASPASLTPAAPTVIPHLSGVLVSPATAPAGHRGLLSDPTSHHGLFPSSVANTGASGADDAEMMPLNSSDDAMHPTANAPVTPSEEPT
jgi:MATE family multidrug resistance protein